MAKLYRINLIDVQDRIQIVPASYVGRDGTAYNRQSAKIIIDDCIISITEKEYNHSLNDMLVEACVNALAIPDPHNLYRNRSRQLERLAKENGDG